MDYEMPSHLIMSIASYTPEVNAHFTSLHKDGVFSFDNICNLGRMMALRQCRELREIIQHSVLGQFSSFDPRDKVYDLLGLLSADPSIPKPDHTAPMEQVYRGFARYCVGAGEGGTILEIAGLERANLALPSWCPDWSTDDGCKRRTDIRRPVLGLDKVTVVNISLLEDEALITAQGCILTRVTKVGPVFQKRELADFR
ncbi:MAG: hypothetical protein M1839_004167 [Geoglossum umbratile]|nr:MAG: hypothetical protein M1839_004167 [Geoglossum umbratile]